MKKIFSFLLLACLTLSATAQTKSQAMKLLNQKERLSNVLNAWQQPAHEQTKLASVPAEWTATAYTAAKAPTELTGLDTTEVFFKSFHDDPIYYPVEIGRNGDTVGGDWYITLKNDRYQFIFDIYGASPESPAGTYTQDDLDLLYSWCMFPEANEKTHYYKTCELTIQELKESEYMTTYILDAVMLVTRGLDGENGESKPEYGYFKVHAEHMMVTTSTRYDVAILNCEVTAEEDRIRIAGKNDTIEADLTFFTELGVEGYYSHKIMDTENSKIIHQGTTYEIMELEGIIAAAETKTGGMAYIFMYETFAYSETDTVFFNVAMEAPIIPTDTIDITCNNAIIDDQWGMSDQTIIITANNDRYEILAAYNDTKVTTPATYPNGMSAVELTDLRTDKSVKSMQCHLTIAGNKIEGYNVEISMLGNDHKHYNIHLSYKIPEPKEIKELNFKNNSKTWLYVDAMGSREVQMANFNDEYSVSFDFPFIDQVMDSEFGRAELFEDQTFIIHHTIEDGAPVDISVTFAEIAGKIWQENDTTFLTATVLGFDSIQYEVSMFYTIPTPTQTIAYTFDGFGDDYVEFVNAVASSRIFTIDAMSANDQLMAKVNVERIENGTVEGTFYNDGKFEHSDFYAPDTYVKVWNTTTEEYDEFTVQKGTMTVKVENEKLTAKASFICDNAVQYDLTFITEYMRERIAWDNEDGEVDYTYAANSQVDFTTQYVESHNQLYFDILAADSTNTTAIVFFTNTTDSVIVIPEGVYPINNSMALGTVYASPGVAVGGGPIQSYFCYTIVEEGDVYFDESGLYCLVDGTVTVENIDGALKLEVDAVNSYDVPVKLHFIGKVADAVDNINTNESISIEKRLINGQLYIIRNGEVYNAVGVRL